MVAYDEAGTWAGNGVMNLEMFKSPKHQVLGVGCESYQRGFTGFQLGYLLDNGVSS